MATYRIPGAKNDFYQASQNLIQVIPENRRPFVLGSTHPASLQLLLEKIRFRPAPS